MCEVKSEYGDLLQEILMHLTLWSHFLKVNGKTQYINSQFYLSCRYSTTNVHGNADTTLVQVMRVVWQSVSTVCVPSVVILLLIMGLSPTGASHQWRGLYQRLISQAQIR